MFFTYVTAAIFISLLVYIFALKNKKSTHLDAEQGHAFVAKGTAKGAAKDDDDKKDLVNA
ncbi:hypothetical protein D3C72_2509170 [compost metagenome]